MLLNVILYAFHVRSTFRKSSLVGCVVLSNRTDRQKRREKSHIEELLKIPGIAATFVVR